ncbi:MAG: hypothetical protein ACKVQJ_02065 [Pyrinomonadaceae bacterium]
MKVICKYFLLLATFWLLSLIGLGQQVPANETKQIKSSPAFAEILLRKTELLADLEAVLADYTESSPKIMDLRFEIASLDRSLEKIFAVKPADAGKLTLALGKLIVRRASLDGERERLTRSYSKDHPEVKRARRRVEVFDLAIKEILQ